MSMAVLPELRWAQLPDAKPLAELEWRSAVYEQRRRPVCRNVQQLIEVWHERIRQKTHSVMLAYLPEELTLVGMLSFAGSIVAGEINALYIEPEYLRQGVGTLLMRTAEQLTVLHGGKRLLVGVEPRNEGGFEFYKALGFIVDGVEPSGLTVMHKEI